MPDFYTYILKCSDGSYYTGHTDDIEKRLNEHATGACGGYTAKRRPVQLVWNESFQKRSDALYAEYQIKGWTRKKKELLIKKGIEAIGGWSKEAKKYKRKS